MGSMSRKLVLIAIVALFSMPGALSGIWPVAAAQSDSDAQILAAYIGRVEGTTPLAGPDAGTLELDGGSGSSHSLVAGIADQLIHVEFVAPVIQPDEVWAVALAFRISANDFHYFILWSDGGWSFAPGKGGPIATGTGLSAMEAGSLITVDIAAVGPAGYTGVNGEYLTTLDLSTLLDPGDVTISANLIGSFDETDEPLSFTNLTVWALSAMAVPVSDSSPAAAVPAPSPTLAVAAPSPTPSVPAPTPTSAEPAASPLDDEATFNSLRQSTLSRPIIFGPISDELPHQAGALAYYSTGVMVTDFAARVECIAPISVSEGFWDCGIGFRDTESGLHHLVAYVSDGYWFHGTGPGETLLSGTDAPTSPSAGNKVTLELFVVGAKGYFGIDGKFLAMLDLSRMPGPGSVDLVSGIFTDTTIEGGSLPFDDFVIWSLDQPGTEPSPPPAVTSPTPTITGAASPTGLAEGFAGVDGTTYVSPQYGYSLSWNDTWSVDDSTSEESRDYLRLSNGVVLVDLIGEPWDPNFGTCFDWIVDYYEQNESYSNIQFATDTVSMYPGVWEITGILTVTYTDPNDGSVTNYIDYAACTPLAGQDVIVSLEQFVTIEDFREQAAAMDDLRGSFVPNIDVVAQPITPTATAGQASNVSGNTYTSPLFGYSLTWDDTWSVVTEDSSDGFDFLRIESDTLVADLYGSAGGNTPDQCIDDLLAYYQGDPQYTNVQFVPDDLGNPMVDSAAGFTSALISYTTTGDDGLPLDSFDYATCVALPDQGALAILEIYMRPSDFVLHQDAIESLIAGFLLPGEGTPPSVAIESTPAPGITETPSGEAPEAPDVDTSTAATFLLEPIGTSGVTGTGTLEAQARLVTITTIVIGAEPGDLVTIYRGTCDQVSTLGEPDYIVGELDDSGLLREEVRVRLTVLLTRDIYSVVIYGGGDDFSLPLACGEIESR